VVRKPDLFPFGVVLDMSTIMTQTKAARTDPIVYNQQFTVAYSYPVYFTRGLFRPGNPILVDTLGRLEPTRRHRLVAFVDEAVASAMPALLAEIAAYVARYGTRLELLAAPETVAGGERAKNTPALIEHLQARLLALGIDRHSYIVAIGGGAVLDLVGYVAATAHRGIRLIRVPTTVLAQNDSGVGVKNGVNAFGVKNFLGTFAPPFAVINDVDFLISLERRDRIAGMVEAVKVALIRDREFFLWLESHVEELVAFELGAVSQLIRRCADLHMRQISTGGDPFETGSARPLDFGHWAAHKLESLTHHELRHGEAVAIGIAIDTRYSVVKGMLPVGEDLRVCRLLERLGFRLWHPAVELQARDGSPALLSGLREFREHLGGELTITLLAGIGRGADVHEMDETEVLRAVAWLRARVEQ
jgi:3-dehydroquinate synthase